MSSISSEMKRLIELVNKIMDYEKFDATELVLDKTSQNPYELLLQIFETQQIYLSEKNQNVVFR